MSLSNRLLFALLGIPLLVYVLMATTLAVNDQDMSRTALEQRLINAGQLLAPALGDALQEADAQRLEALARQLLEREDLRSVTIYDAQGNRLLALGHPTQAPPASTTPRFTQLDTQDVIWRLKTPLMPSTMQLSAVADTSSFTLPGWLEAEADTRSLTLGHYRLLAGLGLGGLLLGLVLFLVAFGISRYATRPLEQAREVLVRLDKGDYRPRMAPYRPREHRALASAINALAEHLHHAKQDMQTQIEQTTSELQESMETIEEQNIKLDLAHRSAVKANAVKSEFLANMSHEIRTPLNGIIGFCRLLGRSSLDTRQKEWLHHVHRACDNLLMLVNDVLDFSKLEAERLTLEQVDLDLVSLVDEVLGLQAPEAQRKHLHLVGLVYDDVPASLKGDPLRIHQVLNNLVSNAIKFTQQGEVIIRVMLEARDGQRVLLKVSVSDSGIGLSETHQKQLFEAFSQATPGHPRQFGGSGLGLTISRQLIQRMGGEISVESQPDKGATFSFTLPLQAGNATEPLPELSLHGERVCLLEAHMPTRHLFHHLLTRWGAKVTTLAEMDSSRLLIIGVETQADGAADAKRWQQAIDSAPCPVLLLVNASPFELPTYRLPHGGEILCKPLSRMQLANAVQNQLTAPTAPVDGECANRQSETLQLLVVDDNTPNRLLLKALLESESVQITLAESGEQALSLAQHTLYDMVLMDIRMPGMDGLETTRALRRLGNGWATCPIVAVTAHVVGSERQQWLASGLDEVLLKPIDEKQLELLLKRFLGVSPRESNQYGNQPSRESASSFTSLAVIDLEMGRRLAGGSENLAREQLRRLIDSLEASGTAIRAAYEASDSTALLDEVHALNGASRYCGVPELALLAETLETRLRAGGIESAGTLLDDLYDAIERLRAERHNL
ncbi:ATP-binding protein [Halomonas sp. Bachu 37]|uniref:ATP-binding protein n=1 Tax=Halomonas kashgarensis TaxID=3084920 RepID=UPI003217FD21